MSLLRGINKAYSWLRSPHVEPFALAVLCFVIVILIALLVGCGTTRLPVLGGFTEPKKPTTDHPTEKTAPATTPEGRAVQAAQAENDDLRQRLAASDAKLESTERAKEKSDRDASAAIIRSWCLWLSIVSLLASAACVALAIFLPVGKTLSVTGAAAGVALMFFFQAVSLAVGYLAWIAGGGAVIFVGVIGWVIVRNRLAHTEFGKVSGEAIDALKAHAPSEWARIRSDATVRQTAKKLTGAMDKLAQRFKPATAKKAA